MAELSVKQEKFIACLLAGTSIVASAKATGVTEMTAHRWLNDERVRAAYKTAQRAIFDATLNQLQSDVRDARDTLISIMKDSNAPHTARVRASQIILEMSINVCTIAELESRLQALEGSKP